MGGLTLDSATELSRIFHYVVVYMARNYAFRRSLRNGFGFQPYLQSSQLWSNDRFRCMWVSRSQLVLSEVVVLGSLMYGRATKPESERPCLAMGFPTSQYNLDPLFYFESHVYSDGLKHLC